MILIIGLGNPGKKYTHNRHNAGFMLVDGLQKEWDFPAFEFNKKVDAEISMGTIKPLLPPGEGARRADEGEKILLVKPQTFMNLSGEALKKIINFYKLTPADIIVAHDDLDIDLGKFKISEDSRAAGHNGVQSVIDTLGTQKFKRIRIGIEGENLREKRKIPGDEFVLKNFTSQEKKIIHDILEKITKELPINF